MESPPYYLQYKIRRTELFRPRQRPTYTYVLVEVGADGECMREVELDEKMTPLHRSHGTDEWIPSPAELRRGELAPAEKFITAERFERFWESAPDFADVYGLGVGPDTFDMRKRTFLEDARLRGADRTFQVSAALGLVLTVMFVGFWDFLLRYAGLPVLFAIFVAAIPTCCFVAALRWLRDIPWTLSRTQCSNCGYDLRGCPEPADGDMLRCPECGLSPDDRVSTPPIEWHVGLIGLFFLIIAIIGALLIVLSVLPSFG